MEIEQIMERLLAKMDATLNEIIENTRAWREATEGNSEEIKSVTVHVNVPKEEATVETFGELKEQYGDQHQVVGRRGQLKKRIQGNGGP
jgi:hypothetical protein